MLQSLDTQFLH